MGGTDRKNFSTLCKRTKKIFHLMWFLHAYFISQNRFTFAWIALQLVQPQQIRIISFTLIKISVSKLKKKEKKKGSNRAAFSKSIHLLLHWEQQKAGTGAMLIPSTWLKQTPADLFSHIFVSWVLWVQEQCLLTLKQLSHPENRPFSLLQNSSALRLHNLWCLLHHTVDRDELLQSWFAILVHSYQ